jgi:hypothetical protein
MGGLKRFSSFKAARESLVDEMECREFDADRMEHFLSEYGGWHKNPYEPGIYRFKTFEEAREFDLQQVVKAAAEREA